jgi:DNA mismatch repair protein MutS2
LEHSHPLYQQLETSSIDPTTSRLFSATLAGLRPESQPPTRDALDIPMKTLRDLQWDALIEELTGEAATPEGILLVSSLPFLDDTQLVKARLDEVQELMNLLDDDEAPPLRGLRDIRRAIAHVIRDGVLIAEDLESIGRNCDVAARTQRYFKSRAERLPRLASIGLQLDPCDELRTTLSTAIEPGGRISDRASPDIARLRRAVQNQHDRLNSAVERMLKSQKLETSLQDEYFTVRDERYVLPIRIGAKGNVQGIVHGYSASGQTAYIEPTELIELNNQLRWAQIELAEEEHRILERLSRLIAKSAPLLTRNTEVMAYLDVVLAKAKLGRRLKATTPILSEDHVALEQARHPLLYLKMERTRRGERQNDTVPNDLVMAEDTRILIISGPNTGGKTVALKMLGLCSLMVRAGLPLPVAEGSTIPLFRSIYTDIGDEQSIERDLSTFSGHIVNINGFLPSCGPDSLVLLDELFIGTDPMQGAALAVALLEELAQRGSKTVVTTHLEGLKTLAYQSEAFANASMGFDLETLQPTYQMTMGVPGSSFAVRIAARLGFSDHLIERTQQILEGQDHHSVEEVLASLEDQMAELQKEQRRLNQARQEAERAQQRFKDKYNTLLTRERENLFQETNKVREDLRKARELVRDQLKALKASGTVAYSQQELQKIQEKVKSAEKAVETAAEKTRPVTPGPKGLARVSKDELEAGMAVFCQPFNREGIVLHYASGDNKAQVQLGDLKVNVDVDKLFYASEAARRDHIRGREPLVTTGAARTGERIVLPQTSDNTLDLRGLRADECLEQLDLFLDSAYLHQLDAVYIIHGHGTGALKRAVRGHLPQSPYVDEFRRGEQGEGGDGVTIVFVKRGG